MYELLHTFCSDFFCFAYCTFSLMMVWHYYYCYYYYCAFEHLSIMQHAMVGKFHMHPLANPSDWSINSPLPNGEFIDQSLGCDYQILQLI